MVEPLPGEREGRESCESLGSEGATPDCCLLHVAGSWLPPDIGWDFAFSFQDSLANAQLMSCRACFSGAYCWSR